ncbi:MAG: hypothetical protein V2I33_10370 [Kangiellaceae bacterium]|jgi:hypothetical protein|nr:hypothetical protein [Kangiellaceae bacterium]
MKKLLLATGLVALSTINVLADEPSFDFVEGGYADNYDADGFLLRFNATVNNDFFLAGSYESVGENSVDLNTTVLGVGYQIESFGNASLYTQLSYLDLEIDTPFGSASEDGYQLGLGYRNQVSKETQLYSELNHKSIDGNGLTELAIGVRQNFTDEFAAFVELKADDFDNDGFSIGLNYNF